MPPHTTTPPLRRTARARGTSSPTGAKMIAASSFSGDGSSDPPAQTAPSDGRNASPPRRPGARRRRVCALEPAPFAPEYDQPRQSHNAQSLALAGHFQAAPADQPGAHSPRPRMWRAVSARVAVFGQGEAEGGVGDDMAGIAAVARVAGERRVVAEVFPGAGAIGAAAAGSPSQGTPAICPGTKPAAPSPIAATSPMISWPGVNGSVGWVNSPSTMCRSVRQTPQASTFSSNCPGPGAGRGRRSRTSGVLGARKTIDRIVAGCISAAVLRLSVRNPASRRRNLRHFAASRSEIEIAIFAFGVSAVIKIAMKFPRPFSMKSGRGFRCRKSSDRRSN